MFGEISNLITKISYFFIVASFKQNTVLLSSEKVLKINCMKFILKKLFTIRLKECFILKLHKCSVTKSERKIIIQAYSIGNQIIGFAIRYTNV